MSKDFTKLLLGANPDRQDRRDKYKSDRYKLSAPPPLPSEFELPFLPPIKDQGQTNSCTGHSSAWFWEQILVSRGFPWVQLSPVFHWYFARKDEGVADKDEGVQMRSIMSALNKFGAVPDSLWPLGSPVDVMPPSEVQLFGSFKLPTYERCDSLQAIKYSLVVEKQAVCIGVPVYDSWYDPAVVKSGIIPYVTNSKPEGGHAVVVCGFSDKNRWLKIANSWSPEFGDQGFIYYPYDAIENDYYDAWTAGFDTLPSATTP